LGRCPNPRQGKWHSPYTPATLAVLGSGRRSADPMEHGLGLVHRVKGGRFAPIGTADGYAALDAANLRAPPVIKKVPFLGITSGFMV